MAFPVTLNGRTYTLADFQGLNYVEGFPDALEDFVTQAGDIYNTTSTTSLAVEVASKTFTVADSGKPYVVGTPLRAASQADPDNFMDGIVTSYTGTTLVLDVKNIGGTGTYADWNITIGGGLAAVEIEGGTFTGSLTVTENLNVTGNATISSDLVASSIETTGGFTEDAEAITSSSNAATLDLSAATNFTHTLTENVTYTFSNPASSGKASAFTLKVVQDSGGNGYTITWPASVDWAGGTAPTLTGDANAVDYFVFITTDGGTTYYGFTAGQALATPA